MQAMVMTPHHPRWQEFVERLEGPEGCNFREDDEGKTIWNCSSETDKPLATAILRKMPDVDLEASLMYFHQHGGHCDCEILFNVDQGEPVACCAETKEN